MDLIEQLGGYEKAKVILQAVGHEHDAMLLEYRRQHNIFEVGDCVIDKVSGQFFKIIEIDDGDLLINNYFWVSSLYQCHATNKEIAAGHRL